MRVAEGGRVSRQRGGPAQSRGPAGLGTPGEDRPALRGRLAASCLPGEWPGLEARPPCGRGGGPERWSLRLRGWGGWPWVGGGDRGGRGAGPGSRPLAGSPRWSGTEGVPWSREQGSVSSLRRSVLRNIR